MNYKEVLALAESKGYKPILCHMEKYGGSGKLPDDIISKAQQACELSLIQQWLMGEHRIFVTVEIGNYLPDKPLYYPRVQSISCKSMGETLLHGFLKEEAYEQALTAGITEALKLI